MQLNTIVYRVAGSRIVAPAAADGDTINNAVWKPIEVTMNEHVQAATSDPLFNPLAPEYIRNPYPHYERMRTTDPVHLTPLGVFVASRHAEVSLVLRDKRYGKEHVARTVRRYGPDIMK